MHIGLIPFAPSRTPSHSRTTAEARRWPAHRPAQLIADADLNTQAARKHDAEYQKSYWIVS